MRKQEQDTPVAPEACFRVLPADVAAGTALQHQQQQHQSSSLALQLLRELTQQAS
jgi:hypothetical protein